jgi:YD repeat-containing protein
VGLLGLVPDPERTATTGIGYDSLGRRSIETTQVGTRPVRTTTSTWALNNGAWRRQVGRPDGQTSQEAYDGLGRLTDLERPWLGRISKWRFNGGLVEREEHSTAASQLDRTLAYDGFSQLKEFAWVQGSQRPYETSFLRDKMGRVVSANRQFAKSGHTSDKGWRGYKYQLSGALEVVFEGDNYAATGGLDPTDTTWAQVQAMAPAVPAARFEYSRDVEGSPLAVQRVDIAGQAPRFHAPPRDRGFQAEWVELDGAQKRTLKHDTAGRVTEEFGRTNTWDDFHSLITVEMHTARQAFQYDGLGRLVAARSGTSWDVEEEVAYDGMQMVAAWNQAGSLTWSAVWGQGIDNLVAVRPNSDGTEAFAMKDGRYRPATSLTPQTGDMVDTWGPGDKRASCPGKRRAPWKRGRSSSRPRRRSRCRSASCADASA